MLVYLDVLQIKHIINFRFLAVFRMNTGNYVSTLTRLAEQIPEIWLDQVFLKTKNKMRY